MQTRICTECGKEFVPKTSNNTLCSAECRAAKRQKRTRKLTSEARATMTCPVCGKIKPAGHRKRKYCSDECMKLAQLEKKRSYHATREGRGNPCLVCSFSENCEGTCTAFEEWFSEAWNVVRRKIMETSHTPTPVGGGLTNNVLSAKAEGLSYGQYMASKYNGG